jgi:beta-N-acetylhexosaminidase
MEGRPPFDPDDLDFDFETPRRRAHERETGERPIQPPPDEPGSSEYATEPPPPAEPPAEAPDDTGEPSYGTGEAPAYDTTGERAYDTGEDPFDTGTSEPAYDTGEDPFDTGERRRRPREKRRGLRLRLPGRRRDRDRRERPLDTGERAALQDDPYTPAEVAVASTRRSRHRDLPAKVRRRQAFLAGAVVVAVLVGIVLLARAVFGGGGGGDESEPLAIKKLVGQTIIGKLPLDGPNPELIRRVKKGQVGGFIVNTPDPAELSGYVTQLQKAAEAGDNPPLLIMVDQEGGDVKRFPEGPPTAAPSDLGETNDGEASKQEGADTAEFLKTAGVNVDLAPVLDVRQDETADTIADRTFSDDPAVVASVGSAFIEGMQGGGVAATGKHFPGLGPATLNTDFAVVTIAASQETLDNALVPFQAAIDAGVELMMISSANYPDYGPENPQDPNKPASQVKAIVQGLLRDKMGFGGVVITDDLESVAIDEIENTATAGVKALGAGCDLILYSGTVGGSEEALVAAAKAVKKGSLNRAEVQASYDRVVDLKNRLVSGSD